MSTAKHTPGPWVARYDYRRDNYQIFGDGRDGMRPWLAITKCESVPAQHEANARLIAAAPELIDVLRECEEYFDQRADAEYFPDSAAPHPNEEMKLLTLVRDAIGKAGA